MHDVPVDKLVERYRKIREHARRSEGQEKKTARELLRKMEAESPDIRARVKAQDERDAVAKANEHVARAAAAKAAAMHGATNGTPSAADQVAYWSTFIEETIAYIADHPNEPAPSAVAFVETLDLGPTGRIFTSIKRMGARAAATWADAQIADQVATLRALQRDLENDPGRVVRNVRDKLAGKKPKKKKRSPKRPPSRKRKKSMSEALLAKLNEECDLRVSDSEDKDSGEELYEIELVIPQALWAKVKEAPEALVAYLNEALLDDTEDDEDDEELPDELDPDDPFPNDTDDDEEELDR